MAEQLNLDVPNMTDPEATEVSSLFLSTNRSEVIRVAALGIVVGLLIPLLSFLVERYIIEPAFCSSANTFQVCASGGLVAHSIAAVALGVVSVIIFVNWQVFRPLVVVVAVIVALWGLKKYMGNIAAVSWWEYMALSGLLYGLTFALFFWAVRLRSFIASFILVIGLVAGFRWFLGL
jgi:hypothetical protein